MQLIVIKYSEDPRLGYPSSRPISRELLQGSCSTAAVAASTLAGVRTALGRPAFTCAVGVALSIHRDAAAVVETHYVDQDNVALIHVHQYEL
jgi:hypothetical protein